MAAPLHAEFVQHKPVDVHKQEAQLSLTNRPTLLPSGELLRFIGRILRLTVIHQRVTFDSSLYWPDFPTYLALSHLTPSMRGVPRSYRVHVWYEKIRTAGLQSGEGRMMIDSVVWAQHINVTATQPRNVTERQPRRHSKRRSTHWRRAAKTI